MRLRGAHLLLAAALVGSGTLLFSYACRLSFIGDEWQLMIGRKSWGADAFLEPFNENLIVGIAAVYKVGLALFGMESALPFYVVSISLFLICAVLLFVYLERRVGGWAASIAAVLVLFLGAAHEDLFWAFQMGFFGSIAAGLGALIALDRDDRAADGLACGLLLVSLAFGSVGLAFVAAAIADLALGRRPRRRRAYVSLVPLAAYAAWLLSWGPSTGGQVSPETALRTPLYVFEAAAAGIVSLLGREPFTASGHPPVIAEALVAIVIVAAGFRLARTGSVSRGTGIALVLALSFWVLIGLDRTPAGRFALPSRYQYPSAVFILILTAELLRGLRIPRPVAAVTAIVCAAAVVGGISMMDFYFPTLWKPYSDQTRLNLAALEIGRPGIASRFTVAFQSFHSTAGAYFAATDRFGSPAYDEAELLNRSGSDRIYVDRTLAEALGIGLVRDSPGGGPRLCRTVGARRGVQTTAVGPGAFTLTDLGSRASRVHLGRFADGFPVGLGQIPPRQTRTLVIPGDASRRRWRLATLHQPLRLCRARAEVAT